MPAGLLACGYPQKHLPIPGSAEQWYSFLITSTYSCGAASAFPPAAEHGIPLHQHRYEKERTLVAKGLYTNLSTVEFFTVKSKRKISTVSNIHQNGRSSFSSEGSARVSRSPSESAEDSPIALALAPFASSMIMSPAIISVM